MIWLSKKKKMDQIHLKAHVGPEILRLRLWYNRFCNNIYTLSPLQGSGCWFNIGTDCTCP